MQEFIKKLSVSREIEEILTAAPSIIVPESRQHLLELAMGGQEDVFEVSYEQADGSVVREATVTKVKNGVVINYDDIYMRRRDPNCMLIADDGETDKERYEARYGKKFDELRAETFAWLKKNDLIVMPFMAGAKDSVGYEALLIAPGNAGFFAGGLADLQFFVPKNEMRDGFKPRAIFFLAPPFRQSHFDGRQMVVHNRQEDMYELFSYNLYPGPSAKKGVYGLLLTIGEQEGWVTLHGSTVSVVTPYDNHINIMHEGASGGGKSEMAEKIHRDAEGQIQVARHAETGEVITLELKESCEILPITDDMALCHPSIQKEGNKLHVQDAEGGWFLRTDNIKAYGTDPYLERMTIHPKEPLIFLNYDAVPHSTCLIWEHIEDAPGKPCPNPRAIVPRHHVPNVVEGAVDVDVRSFGVRTPICTKESPSYGIVGMLHILPPALAWLWRLVSPRGHANPSITDTEGMSSEGVGSYWPFATGKKVKQANLLLRQMVQASGTRYILVPNQHIGAYQVGFMPQWIAREYLARRGSASFKEHQLVPARSALLGYTLESMKVDGTYIPRSLLQTHKQIEVENEGYDAGAAILSDFFKREIAQYLTDELDPLGQEIIRCCLNDGSLEDYLALMPMKY